MASIYSKLEVGRRVHEVSSVAESELCAVKGASILFGAKSMMIDFGEDVGQCVSGTDSSSAKSIMERRGAERIRHLHRPMLWPHVWTRM